MPELNRRLTFSTDGGDWAPIPSPSPALDLSFRPVSPARPADGLSRTCAPPKVLKGNTKLIDDEYVLYTSHSVQKRCVVLKRFVTFVYR